MRYSSVSVPCHPLPFRGVVAAGWPSPAEEELGDLLSFEEWLLPHKGSSVLIRVESDAMEGAGILPGDTVIVERGRRARLGHVVVADVDGVWVLRRYTQRNGRPVLVSAHKNSSVFEPSEDLKLIGVVTAVIRKYF